MKKYIWVTFFLLLTECVQAQFFDSTVHYLTVECRSVDDHGCTHSSYQLLLDSSKADTQYFQIKYSHGGNKYNKYLKTIDRRVYIKTSADYSLLYDFSLKVGDTVKVLENMQELYGVIQPNSNYILDSITRVKLGADSFNLFHVRVGNHYKMIDLRVIDGIGSLENGVFYFDHLQFEDNSDLLTICKNGELLVYRNHYVVKSGQNTCQPVFYKTNLSELVGGAHLQVFPNPGSGHFALNTSEWMLKDVQVISASGQLVYDVLATTSNEIDLSLLNSGVYQVLVKIQGVLLMQKLVIE